MSELFERLADVPVIPILRSPTVASAVSSARSLAAGGMRVLELTFSTPGVVDAISELSRDDDVIVGAGTILDREQAHAAVDAGARFLVSPVWLPWLPELALDRDVDCVIGAASPSEVWQAHSLGATAVKLFPIARLGGAAYVRDLLAPMPELRLIATGGVDVGAARELLDSGCVGVGVGTFAVTPADAPLPPEEQARRFLAELSVGSGRVR